MFAAPIPTDDVHNLLLSRWFTSVMNIDLERAAERVLDHYLAAVVSDGQLL
jgi:hypothetical protein